MSSGSQTCALSVPPSGATNFQTLPTKELSEVLTAGRDQFRCYMSLKMSFAKVLIACRRFGRMIILRISYSVCSKALKNFIMKLCYWAFIIGFRQSLRPSKDSNTRWTCSSATSTFLRSSCIFSVSKQAICPVRYLRSIVCGTLSFSQRSAPIALFCCPVMNLLSP